MGDEMGNETGRACSMEHKMRITGKCKHLVGKIWKEEQTTWKAGEKEDDNNKIDLKQVMRVWPKVHRD